MNYKTVQEMAVFWNINVRTVQMWAKQGKLEGIQKFGRDWMIPENCIAPNHKLKQDVSSKAPIKLLAMPLMNGNFIPGKALDYIKSLKDDESKLLAKAEYYYFCGVPNLANDNAVPLLTSKVLTTRLSALLVHCFSNIGLGNVEQVKTDFMQLKNEIKVKAISLSEEEYALCAFVSSMTEILLHNVSNDSVRLENHAKNLPEGMKLFSFYALAHLYYLKGDYSRSLGISETGLLMNQAIYPIPMIYLYLIAAMAAMNLKKNKQGKQYFNQAWELAKPDHLLQPFAEHHGLLEGLIEVILKKEEPSDYKKIIDITYSFSDGWRKIHNPKTKESVTSVLSTTEFTIAMLASKKWTNKQIAQHMNLSTSTVKTYISHIYDKLQITNRKELNKYMLK
ncbi:MAG: LuxR C-terminal-related transcriptional regulator [Erysipelotrichaceae bacterium]